MTPPQLIGPVDGVVLVASTSRPGYWAAVHLTGDGTLTCTCPAGDRASSCRHIAMASAHITATTARSLRLVPGGVR